MCVHVAVCVCVRVSYSCFIKLYRNGSHRYVIMVGTLLASASPTASLNHAFCFIINILHIYLSKCLY